MVTTILDLKFEKKILKSVLSTPLNGKVQKN